MSDYQSEFKRGTRLLWLFTFLPFLIMGAIFLGGRVPPVWRNFYFLAVFGTALGIIFSVPIREHNRKVRKLGFAPVKKGFSGKLEAMAVIFRRHAEEIEAGLREGEAVSGFSPDLQAEYNELLRVAREQDKKTPLSSFKIDIAGKADDDDEDGPMSEKAKQQLANQANRLREKAGEMELYAQQLRGRGGLFKLGIVQLIYGGVLIIAAFAWGCSLMWKWWDIPSWTFFGGAALIVSSIVIGYGLFRSQTDPA